ncbi:hypothetical protein GLOIN_2v1012983 [Rhizophagus irregularis DAOM 181602=DAOM 197198]|uniref:Uncharacterized protein n=1 Tax=Rhizophagus irregularis (strain DAOM 181602 / DAOM 197198 / MUCL 43194) TaxID=747089 RepID=A0A2P4NWW8_RHIID|nr:hypothetical protein GLOIN_2v1012983 [Rhizophagus irregularis DAOM 181602=DAOM 197198]POG57639.1 hypothetical protein GLOIN_2v1012983 [Rhizophagus irregularis DAOM 181602=DAOM 197198]GET51208.1 hypothetical protein GLOIN_2v1012983 [Rhizophagus irregularis DAOM 181602=DAOM 197198]GET66689.1 hypothetical protein GLOIN_2v1012983 [Rhizophagus irregularis DAOM 181602=DAOM 197198]|eukprot:XP_025164505.1 hypothetical protein GLOIN_2v1012983 [Rhizophagus irregularis DAOM 181602=DAOM 197198]
MDNEHENTTFLAFHYYTYIANCLTPALLQDLNQNKRTKIFRSTQFICKIYFVMQAITQMICLLHILLHIHIFIVAEKNSLLYTQLYYTYYSYNSFAHIKYL